MAAITLAVLVAVTIWAVLIEPRFVLDEQAELAVVPQLPAPWRGAQVAVVGDLQVGMWFGNVDMARDAIGAMIDREPDIALVLGDFVYGEDDVRANVDTAVEIVARLPEAGIPTFAVLGNHDHASGAADLLTRALDDAGVRVLDGEAVQLEREGSPLHVAGIGSVLRADAEPEDAVNGIPPDAARIVMMHNPASFDGLPPSTAPLAVAGHTHGGQLRVPFMPEWSFLSLVEDHAVHADGWIDGYGASGNRLFVNRGIGMSLIPARFNCSPAVTFFTLTADGR